MKTYPWAPAEIQESVVGFLDYQMSRLKKLRDYIAALPKDASILTALAESDARIDALRDDLYEQEKHLPLNVQCSHDRIERNLFYGGYASIQKGEAFNGQCGDEEDPAPFVDWFAKQAHCAVDEVRQLWQAKGA